MSACSRTSAMRSPSTRITRPYWLWARVPPQIATARGDAEPHLSVKEPDPFTQAGSPDACGLDVCGRGEGHGERECRHRRGVRECACGARSPGGGDDVCATAWSARSSFFRSPRRSRALTGVAGARTGAARGEPVTVASFDFAESRLLAEIYAQALERAGLPVRRAFGLGPRELVAPALASGLVDVVPEYAGTAVQFLSLGPRAIPRPTCRGDPRALWSTRCDGTVGPGARAGTGAGHQRLRRPPRGRRASRAHAAERPPRRVAAS